MSYRTTGGYFIGSDAQHDVLLETPPNSYQTGCAAIMSGQPAPDQGDAVAAAQELRSQGVTVVVVVVGNGADSPVLLDWTRLVTGTTGYHDDDVWVFRIAQPVPH